jgi:hypothetical protein
MSRTFYPSDEYDSEDLERAAKSARRSLRRWFRNCSRNDDHDDDPPMSPVGATKSGPLTPVPNGAAVAA